MKCIALVLAAVLFVPGSRAQEKKPWDIDRLCGQLKHLQRIPNRKKPDTFSESWKELRDVSLVLYERRESELCCAGLNPVETITTGKNGRFEFKTTKPGDYWVGVNWSGKEYKLSVIYTSQKNSTTMCSEQGIGLGDNGNASWWTTIILD